MNVTSGSRAASGFFNEKLANVKLPHKHGPHLTHNLLVPYRSNTYSSFVIG